MSIYAQQIALYCQGTFDFPNPTLAKQQQMTADAEVIGQAGYTTVLLGQWMAKTQNGVFDIYYNTPFGTDFDWVMSNIPDLLHKNGVTYVTLTFGPFPWIFDEITSNLAAFKKIMLDIFEKYPINGLDFNIEVSYSAANMQTLADLADWIDYQNKNNPKITQPLITTASPYTNMSWWSQLLTKTSNFAWFNIQSSYFNGYSSWVTGLPASPDFLLYGFNIGDMNTNTPSEINTLLHDTKQTYPDMLGTVLWKYEDMDKAGQVPPADWQQAALDGM